MDIPDLEIPDLELENLVAPTATDAAVEDKSGGSVCFAWIGSGQGGGRLAKAFWDRGYHKCLAVNTSRQDLDCLELPTEQKLLLDIGEEGAGKNMERGGAAAAKYKQEIFNLMRKVYGKVDHIMVCVGAGGGTGSGSSLALIEIAKKYMKFIGHDHPNNRVGVVDNSKIEKMYKNLTVKEFWSTINNTVSGLFHIFNVLSKHPSQYTSFDPTDYATTLRCGGAMVMGVSKIDMEAGKKLSETEISNTIKSNIDKTLLAEIDISDAKVAACCAVGGKDIMSSTPGLMDSLSYGFDTLSSLCPAATLHRGIYEDVKPTLRLYTLVSGLKIPQSRLDQLASNCSKEDIDFTPTHPFGTQG